MKRRRRWWIRGLLAILGFTIICAFGLVLAVALTPLPADPLALQSAQSSRVVDRTGVTLASLPAGGWHRIVPLASIPIALQNALIAAEDATFYTNPGVDVLAVARAAVLDVQHLGHNLYGGSTITQQLVRNVLLSPTERTAQTFSRKIHEALLALRLTGTLSKQQILALYLNNVYFGHLTYGVEAAAEAYFGRPVSTLDIAQCALLAGLPQAPSADDPLINPAAAMQRRNTVLSLMHTHGYLSTMAMREGQGEPLGLATSDALLTVRAPHFVNAVIGLLNARLGNDRVRQGGLTITTTLDLGMQSLAEQAVTRQVAALAAHNVHDAALVAIDPGDGHVLALVGSAGYTNDAIAGAVDVALSPRQPGSAIKMFTYAAAFQDGLSPGSVVADVPRTFITAQGHPYQPLNYDLSFHGLVSLRTALGSSLNVPAVTVLNQVGIPHMLAVAHAMGITTLNTPARYGLALTLGGGEVRLLDLTAAYGVLATAGVRHAPVFITAVADTAGHAVGEWQAPTARQVLGMHGAQVAALLTNVLADDTARLLGFGEGSALVLDRPAAVKTGTTTDWRDNWTVGYTPNLVTGVWVGNADNAPMQDVSGVTGAAPIWHEFMQRALASTSPQPFAWPTGLVWRTVCVESGLLATPACPHQATEPYIAGTEPQQPDQTFRVYTLDIRTGRQATSTTPPLDRQAEVVEAVPPLVEAWARSQGIVTTPPLAASGAGLAGVSAVPSSAPLLGTVSAAPQITAPAPRSVYALTTVLPGADQQIAISAQPGATPAAALDLIVDGRLLARCPNGPCAAYWPLRVGGHRLWAAAHLASGRILSSPIVTLTVLPAVQPGTGS